MADKFAIQRMNDGTYLARSALEAGIEWTPDPGRAQDFPTRSAANTMRVSLSLEGTGIARLPTHGSVKIG